MIRLDTTNTHDFYEMTPAMQERADNAHQQVVSKSGKGAEFLGWRDLLLSPNDALLEDLVQTAERIREEADVLVCIGIGGSYLGARAVIDALTEFFPVDDGGPEIIFAGHHMGDAYHSQLLRYLEGKSVFVNVISKSGTTLEPALAFRFLRNWLEARFADADKRIIVTTDPSKGALNILQSERGYTKYVIPPDVGGRFSVLTPVGLLPIAVAGVDIQALFYGAVSKLKEIDSEKGNDAVQYAATRVGLFEKGFSTEVLACFEPALSGIGGWWQQLFGESEGKEHTGVFPAALQYSTDLHSMGQYMQDGERKLMETFLMIDSHKSALTVPPSEDNLDGLNYISGKEVTFVNRQAYEGTSRAHRNGGVPNMTVWLDSLTPDCIGASLYFFEHAVAISGYLLGVNPFDQPGVEAYKNEMFQLLGKPEKPA
ncbi:MAG: glucose-6-phosphate isomerase [Rhodothermales bacterium]|nr:glucose-6-phosphate isomerase [Rhodothermales bacterium]